MKNSMSDRRLLAQMSLPNHASFTDRLTGSPDVTELFMGSPESDDSYMAMANMPYAQNVAQGDPKRKLSMKGFFQKNGPLGTVRDASAGALLAEGIDSAQRLKRRMTNTWLIQTKGFKVLTTNIGTTPQKLNRLRYTMTLNVAASNSTFDTQIFAGTYAALTWTLDPAVLGAGVRNYYELDTTIGIPQLTNARNNSLTLTFTMPLNDGTSTTFIATGLMTSARCEINVRPYALTNTVAFPVPGRWDNSVRPVVTITGLQSDAQPKLTIPGTASSHFVRMLNF